jgi:exonuclease SbcD
MINCSLHNSLNNLRESFQVIFLDITVRFMKTLWIMEPIQLLHIADTHIGVENYGRLDTETGLHTRLQDFVKCLTFAVDTALERDVDAVLFAGDAYKQSSPNPTHEVLFAEQMKRLANHHIPVIMVAGNHDVPASFGKASALNIFRTLGGEEHFMVAEKPLLTTIHTKQGPLQVACFPWPTRHALLTKDEYKNLSDDELTKTIEQKCESILEKYARDLDSTIPAVLLAHLAVANAVYSGSERSVIIGADPVIAVSTLNNPAFDYVALGHIHKHQDLNRHGHPHIVYPGSIERVNFGEAREEKGFCLVSVKKGESSFQFVPTPARKFVEIDIDVRNQDFPTEVILQKLTTVDIVDAVVRLSYLVDPEQKGLVDEPRLYAALKDAFLIAGINRKTEETRSQRPRIAGGLTTMDTLAEYIKYTPDLQPLKEDLQIYAERLIRELEMAE